MNEDYWHLRVSGWCHTCGGTGDPAIPHREAKTAIERFDQLTSAERKVMAHWIRCEAARLHDPRLDPEIAEYQRLRWRKIANSLDPLSEVIAQ